MDIFKIVALGIVSTIIIILLKETKPEMAVLLGVGTGIVIIIMIFDQLFDVIYAFYNIADITNLDKGLFSAILKIIGVGYLTEFSSNICVDAGSKSVGDKIMLGGKVVIMILALPIINALIKIIVDILP